MAVDDHVSITHSPYTHLLAKCPVYTSIGHHAISYAAPQIWNAIPSNINNWTSVISFTLLLLFLKIPDHVPPMTPTQHLWFCKSDRHFVHFTNVSTYGYCMSMSWRLNVNIKLQLHWGIKHTFHHHSSAATASIHSPHWQTLKLRLCLQTSLQSVHITSTPHLYYYYENNYNGDNNDHSSAKLRVQNKRTFSETSCTTLQDRNTGKKKLFRSQSCCTMEFVTWICCVFYKCSDVWIQTR